MTAEETLISLINKGIIHKIGEGYFLTSEATKLEANLNAPSTIEITHKSIDMRLYPRDIREASTDGKVEAILNYCKVPMTSKTGTYMLRSCNTKARAVLKSILENGAFKPLVLLQSITDYYKFMDYPKGFTRYIMDKDIYIMYSYYAEGKVLSTDEMPSNLSWQQ